MRICIYGAGSLGTVMGAFLAKSGFDVDLVTRNREHVEGLNEGGARIRGTMEMTVPVRALTPDRMEGTYDCIFLLTKQQENDKVVRSLVPFLKEEGLFCTFQNGIPEYGISGIIDPQWVYGCAVGWGATLIGGGVCELTSEPDSIVFNLGSFHGSEGAGIERIGAILENMGRVVIERNFIGARWSKLLINSAFSGISAILGCTYGEAAAHKRGRKYIQKLIKESIDLAKRENVVIEPVQGKDIVKLFDYRSALKEKFSYMIIPLAIRKHALLKPSMLQDLEKGKKTEVDFINGTFSSIGRKSGFPTPYNDMVVAIMHEIEEGKRSCGYANLEPFETIRP